VADMCLDSHHLSTELQAATLYPIDPSRRDVITERYKAVQSGCHACLQLAGTNGSSQNIISIAVWSMIVHVTFDSISHVLLFSVMHRSSYVCCLSNARVTGRDIGHW